MISQKSTKYANASTILLFAIALSSLLTISLIRNYSYGDILPGEGSYNIARLAKEIQSENNLIFYDRLSYDGRILSLQQGTPLTLALFSKLFSISIDASSRILPIILGMISLIVFYLIVRKLLENKRSAQLSILFLLLSPPFLYTFSTSNTRMLPITLTLLGVSFLLYKKTIPAAIIFAIIPFFGTLHSMIALALFFIHVVVGKQNKKLFFFILAINLVLIGLLNVPTIKAYGLPSMLDFRIKELGLNFTFQNFIAEFGGVFGLSIFSIILALSGFAAMWKKKFHYLTIYIALFLFILLSIYLVWPIIHLNFLISILAAIGLTNLRSIKWESRLIKNFTMIILLSGLIVTFLIHINYISSLPPNQDIIDSLEALNAESNPEDVVLSHYSNGLWIESIASRPVLMDSSFVYAPGVNEKYADTQKIFSSRSIDEVAPLLEKYRIRFILITNDMKSGEVWKNEEDGLLFLLKYNTRFKKLFSNQDTELWWYIGE